MLRPGVMGGVSAGREGFYFWGFFFLLIFWGFVLVGGWGWFGKGFVILV
jgi:hypothetical protein